MLDKLSGVGGALVVGLGLVVAVTGPPVPPIAATAKYQLTATVLAMGGIGYETIDQDLMKRVLAGYFADEENLVGLPWPGQMAPWNGTLTLDQSVAVGLENMDAAIRSTPGPKIVAGASGTTLVVDEQMRRLADDPTAPPADELSFVVLGDANRGAFKQFQGMTLPIFDYTVPEIPVTKYDVMVFAGEYDGIADWPDRSWNLLAVLNAMAGSGMLQQIIPQQIVDEFELEAYGSVHYDAMFADLAQVPKENITTVVNAKGGVTTTYLVPTSDLPILRPLKAKGVPQDVIDTLEKVLRPIIDSGYARNDPFRSHNPIIKATRRPARAATATSAATNPPQTASKSTPARTMAAGIAEPPPDLRLPGDAGPEPR